MHTVCGTSWCISCIFVARIALSCVVFTHRALVVHAHCMWVIAEHCLCSCCSVSILLCVAWPFIVYPSKVYVIHQLVLAHLSYWGRAMAMAPNKKNSSSHWRCEGANLEETVEGFEYTKDNTSPSQQCTYVV